MTDESISIDTGTDELLCVIRDRVAVITLNRPEARNALSDHLTPALRRMIKRNGDYPEVGALLITGAGTAFCSGGDVKGMGSNSAAPAMSVREKVERLRDRQRTLTGVTCLGAEAHHRGLAGTGGWRRTCYRARLRHSYCGRIRHRDDWLRQPAITAFRGY